MLKIKLAATKAYKSCALSLAAGNNVTFFAIDATTWIETGTSHAN